MRSKVFHEIYKCFDIKYSNVRINFSKNINTNFDSDQVHDYNDDDGVNDNLNVNNYEKLINNENDRKLVKQIIKDYNYLCRRNLPTPWTINEIQMSSLIKNKTFNGRREYFLSHFKIELDSIVKERKRELRKIT